MIKHLVGKVRTTSYSLPDDHDPTFTYGIANKIDPENAGKVVQSWAQSRTAKQETVRCFPATNRKALQHGCLTSKSQREFAVHQPVMKALNKPKASSLGKLEEQGQRDHDITTDQVFGIKSLKNDLPFKELLKSGGDFQEKDYPNLSKRQKRGRIPPSKVTRASRLLEASIKTASMRAAAAGAHQQQGSFLTKGIMGGQQPKDHHSCFKMKRFLRVESKVKAMLQEVR